MKNLILNLTMIALLLVAMIDCDQVNDDVSPARSVVYTLDDLLSVVPVRGDFNGNDVEWERAPQHLWNQCTKNASS